MDCPFCDAEEGTCTCNEDLDYLTEEEKSDMFIDIERGRQKLKRGYTDTSFDNIVESRGGDFSVTFNSSDGNMADMLEQAAKWLHDFEDAYQHDTSQDFVFFSSIDFTHSEFGAHLTLRASTNKGTYQKYNYNMEPIDN